MKRPLLKIILKNTLTLFNLVNLVLALMVLYTGSLKNLLFVFIALANTLISIINEFRAYKIVSKMRLMTEQKPNIERDGKVYSLDKSEVKVGDIILLGLGDQIPFDATLISGFLEVNEAFITGEQDNIEKHENDPLTSGSFVVSGSARAKINHIGKDNFIEKLESSASNIKTADSKLFTIMNNIVKYISLALIPVGILLFWSRLNLEHSETNSAIISTVAALINMIPEGLILLTSSVLALATIRLSKKQVLVQDLYSIETLARVDCIALDKTGTLTTGNMSVDDFLALDDSFETVLKTILAHDSSNNATAKALKKKFLKTPLKREIEGILEGIPFSSDRKYSGFRTKDAEYLLGAPEFIITDSETLKKAKDFSHGSRTLAVVGRVVEHERVTTFQGDPQTNGFGGKKSRQDPLGDVSLLGLIRLKDDLRPNIKKIIQYFYDNNIDIKIISGDDLDAVKTIAEKVGLKNLNGINLSTLPKKNYENLVKNYSIFTRVTPSEKKSLILALKKQGNTVAMTGDGVNDILAMKEADCSIAIGDGSDAARRSAKLVLLNSDFSAVPSIIAEGRQSINNLERSTVLFLTKTVYASILAVVFIFLPFKYPFIPISMTLLNVLCIGFPGFVLALEPNTTRIKNQFVKNIKKFSLPTGLIISLTIIILSILNSTVLPLSPLLDFLDPNLNASALFAVIITFILDFILLYRISRPLSKFRLALLIFILLAFVFILLLPLSRNFFFQSF